MEPERDEFRRKKVSHQSQSIASGSRGGAPFLAFSPFLFFTGGAIIKLKTVAFKDFIAL